MDIWIVFMLLFNCYLLDILIASEELTYSREVGRGMDIERGK